MGTHGFMLNAAAIFLSWEMWLPLTFMEVGIHLSRSHCGYSAACPPCSDQLCSDGHRLQSVGHSFSDRLAIPL